MRRYSLLMMRTPLSPPPLVYAHRGDRSRADDNTIEAYRLAVEAATDGIELDVRRTSDGVLIVSHDDRPPDLEPFSVLRFEVLRELAPFVPTLREALAAIPLNVFVNVEIKNFTYDAGYDERRTLVDETLEALSDFDDPARILLSSFDVLSLKRAREIDQEILCGQLLLQVLPLDAGIKVAQELGLDAVVPHLDHVRHDPVALVRRIRAADLATVVWGVDSREDVTVMASAGVDAIITDNPGMARQVIDQR